MRNLNPVLIFIVGLQTLVCRACCCHHSVRSVTHFADEYGKVSQPVWAVSHSHYKARTELHICWNHGSVRPTLEWRRLWAATDGAEVAAIRRNTHWYVCEWWSFEGGPAWFWHSGTLTCIRLTHLHLLTKKSSILNSLWATCRHLGDRLCMRYSWVSGFFA